MRLGSSLAHHRPDLLSVEVPGRVLRRVEGELDDAMGCRRVNIVVRRHPPQLKQEPEEHPRSIGPTPGTCPCLQADNRSRRQDRSPEKSFRRCRDPHERRRHVAMASCRVRRQARARPRMCSRPRGVGSCGHAPAACCVRSAASSRSASCGDKVSSAQCAAPHQRHGPATAWSRPAAGSTGRGASG